MPASAAPDLVLGSIKHSDDGRALSGASIREFVNQKLIRVGAYRGQPQSGLR